MTQSARARAADPAQPRNDPWPRDVSRQATMTIGSVIAVLKPEFPAITISKIRFLEDQGLVTPQRTGSGYRKFSQADVSRLRYALSQQRDHYLPLKVIKEQLDALDSGEEPAEHRTARVITRDGALVVPAGGARLNVRELSELTGTPSATIEELVASGVLVPDRYGRLSTHSIGIVTAVATLGEHGIDARHVRSMRQSADRVADLIGQVAAPMRSQTSTVARERAAAQTAELAESASALYGHFVRAAIDSQEN